MNASRVFSFAKTAVACVALIAFASVPLTSCLTDEEFGPWTALSTEQFGVPLVAGTTTVEVRDVRDGWVERVSVESDGRTLTNGIDVEPLQPALETKRSDEDIAYLRGDSTNVILETGTAYERATALNAWVGTRFSKAQVSRFERAPLAEPNDDQSSATDEMRPHNEPGAAPPGKRAGEAPVESDDACEVLRSVEEGARSNCRSVATVYFGAASLAGLIARRVDFSVRYGSPHEGHSVVEVWSPELSNWMVIDSYFQCVWNVDGHPASAIELNRAAVEGRSKAITFTSTGPDGKSLSASRVNPRLYPRNVFIRTASGAWLTRTNGVPAPVVDTNILQCDDDAVFAAVPGAADAFTVRRDSRHGRIAFQAIDGRLVIGFARALFESGRFEARALNGRSIEVFDDSVTFDPSDPEIASGPELISRTRLVDDDHDGRPDGWDVESAPSAFETRPDGTATLESGEIGALLTLEPSSNIMSSVVGFARLSVERGSARFSLSGRQVRTAFVVRGGRETTACTPISGWGATDGGLRLELAPNSRVTVAWISLRTTPKYDDMVGAPVP